MGEGNHSKTYPPVGRCIYCGTTAGKLTKEHIIPFGLGGTWVLPKASCLKCAKITGAFELFCQRSMLGPFRIHLKLPTRRPQERPAHLPIEFIRLDGSRVRETVPADQFPRNCIGFRFPAPGLLREMYATEDYDGGELVSRIFPEDVLGYPEGQRVKVGTINILAFCRMLAKIAHSYAVAEYGLASFNPLLPDLILGRSAYAPYLVGGDESGPAPETEPCLHDVYRQDCLNNGIRYMLITIRLFAFVGMPRYHVVAGEALDGGEGV